MASYVDLNTIHNPATGTSPPASWGDQARDNDQYLWERGPYICTAATRPASPFAGQTIFETDTLKTLQYSGSAWWTTAITGNGVSTSAPTVFQGAGVGITIVTSNYRVINGVCDWWYQINTTIGTAGYVVTLALPVTSAEVNVTNIGSGIIYDASTGVIYVCSIEQATTTTVSFQTDLGVNAMWGITPSIALGTGDELRGFARFRVATAA
jgi:hypothetical protein